MLSQPPALKVALAGCAATFLGTLLPWQQADVGDASVYSPGIENLQGLVVLAAALGAAYLLYLSVTDSRPSLLAGVICLALAALGISAAQVVALEANGSGAFGSDGEVGSSWGLWLCVAGSFAWLGGTHVEMPGRGGSHGDWVGARQQDPPN